MRWPRFVVLLVLVVTAGVAAAGSASAHEVKEEGPLARVPRVGQAKPPSFVGVDSAGRLVGVSLTDEGHLVAYVCDGADTGVWFEGTYKKGATTATLKGKKGARLELDLTSDPLSGTVKIGETQESFTLATAVGSAGLYRKQHGKRVSGWIVDNNGAIYGVTSDESGKIVNSVQTGTPSSDPPVEVGSADPVTTRFVRCAVAQFRLERATKKGGDTSTATAARDAACNPGGAQ